MSTFDRVAPLPRSWMYKVAGGSSESITQVPFQAYLADSATNEIHCGATILSTLVILTAAHCLTGRSASSLKLVAGDQRRSTEDGPEQRIPLAHIHLHESFVYGSSDHDIAIAVLASPLTFNRHVNKIDFPLEPRSYIGNATISGWGKTNDNDNRFSDSLLSARIPILSVADCAKKWSENPVISISHNYICAFESGVDACQGDSGGPLTGRKGTKRIILGVVAVGPACETDNVVPGIYINVSRYGSWILLKMLEAGAYPTKCPKGQFWCTSSSKCIPSSYVCDGDNDCGNHEDEANCKICQKGKFRCPSSNKCISASKWCDGRNDCPDREDEASGCDSPCPDGGYRCSRDKRCIPSWAKCNWIGDCDGEDDEANCAAAPTFTCAGDESTKIPINWKCDGVRDCPSGDDESGCANTCSVACRPYQNNRFNEAITKCCQDAGKSYGYCNPGNIPICQ